MKKQNLQGLSASLAGAGLMAVCSALLVAGSTPLYKAMAGRNRPLSDTPVYRAGTYEGTARGYGGLITVKLTVSEYGIEDVKIEAPDETPDIGQSAADQLSEEIWQTNSFRIDSVSGATMTSNGIKEALGECISEAALEDTELYRLFQAEYGDEAKEESMPEIAQLLAETEDGVYSYTDTEDDGSGHFNRIRLTVKNGAIESLTWDAVTADGSSGKRESSKNGGYIMTEDGPLWYEQADALAAYVVENQTTDGIAENAGTIDALASVSIYTGGFVDSVKKCLMEAAQE